MNTEQARIFVSVWNGDAASLTKVVEDLKVLLPEGNWDKKKANAFANTLRNNKVKLKSYKGTGRGNTSIDFAALREIS